MTLQVLLGHVANGSNRGERYHVPLTHSVITGMTQYGKSTTEEAMLNRLPETKPPYRALVFLTKRGEKVFQGAHTIPPFYRERFDWEYVRGLLESAMKEKMKFETPWIIRICKQAQVELKQTYRNLRSVPRLEGLLTVRRLLTNVLQREKLRDFDRNIYTLLAAYMDKVLPVLQQAKGEFTDTLTLMPGINVMDLTEWYTHEEFQMLVIRSCMEQILECENNIIVGLPEAWKMLPQGRNTPVKLYFEKFVREGATNGNYLYIDAQDLGGVDKTPLRQVDVWIMGHMLEANEVERLLKQTLGVDVPAATIQTLPLGHFLVAAAGQVVKVYVWPHDVPEEMSVDVAMGRLQPEAVKEYIQKMQSQLPKPKEIEVTTYMRDIENRVEALSRRVDTVAKDLNDLVKVVGELPQIIRDHIGDPVLHSRGNTTSIASMEIEHEGIEAIIHHRGDRQVKFSTSNAEGKILYCIVKELSAEGFGVGELKDKLVEHGWSLKNGTISAKLSIMTSQGKLVKTEKGYRLPTKVKYKTSDDLTDATCRAEER
jgi:hypothetical protein